METPYILTFGSFIRNGKYPLEADYIFDSEEALKQWESDNKKYLHEGLFKVVVTEDLLTLYWCHNDTFEPVVTSESLSNLTLVLKDFELHGTLRSKLAAFLLELDLTQLGVGLNGDGTFDTLNMLDTEYLSQAKSVIECLKALDKKLKDVNTLDFTIGDSLDLENGILNVKPISEDELNNILFNINENE